MAGGAFGIRVATPDDEPALWQALFEAAHLAEEGFTSVDVVKARADLAHYIAGWMLPGDIGVVAEAENGAPIGAAWVRLLTAADPGYGYVDDETPELAIGILPAHRGCGVGTALMTELIELTKPHYGGISLSTRAANTPALRLYERVGFRKIPGTEVTNWAGGLSYNMKVSFGDAA